jgi:predicted dehydrogenase
MMKHYKWGIIGPGKIANKFAVALNLAGNASLEAVASRDAARARDFAEKFGAARSYDNYIQLAEDPAIDVVYIATPHGFHAEHALLCLQHGKAVLCEKPMALYSRQVESMVGAARQHRVFLMEAMWTRFVPVMEKILELVRDGRLGTVRYVRADFGFAGPYSPDNRLFNLRLGGGSLLDIGIYPLFLCLQLLGEPDGIQASGHLSDTGADESCQAILQYRDGRAGMIYSTFACQTSVSAEIAGSEGLIQLPGSWHKSDSFTLRPKGEDPVTIRVEAMLNGFEYQIREVTQCLDKGLLESPMMPHAFSRTMSRTMDAIRQQIGVKYPGE